MKGNLSERERYLLIAGILLHDIGMQCDVVQYPEIREKAIELGANFTEKFDAKRSSGFSLNEQNSIRINHQYLSGAWILISKKTKDTTLGNAIQTVPEELLVDLIDICIYHSKKPISDCPSFLKVYPNERKKFIAALLRIGDELDIHHRRVTMAAVKDFRLYPFNEYYWWIHHITYISIKEYSIIIKIRLNSDDFAKYKDLIQDVIVEDFKAKNSTIIDVLKEYEIPLAIDGYSGGELDPTVESLPREVLNMIESKKKTIRKT